MLCSCFGGLGSPLQEAHTHAPRPPATHPELQLGATTSRQSFSGRSVPALAPMGTTGSIAQRARPDLEPSKPRASFVSPSYPPRRPLSFSWPAGASQLSPALPLAPVRASLELHPKLGSPVANPKPAKTPSSTRARRFPVPGPGTLPSKRKWVENSTQGFSGTASP